MGHTGILFRVSLRALGPFPLVLCLASPPQITFRSLRALRTSPVRSARAPWAKPPPPTGRRVGSSSVRRGRHARLRGPRRPPAARRGCRPRHSHHLRPKRWTPSHVSAPHSTYGDMLIASTISLACPLAHSVRRKPSRRKPNPEHALKLALPFRVLCGSQSDRCGAQPTDIERPR